MYTHNVNGLENNKDLNKNNLYQDEDMRKYKKIT